MGRYSKTRYTGVFIQPSSHRRHKGRLDQAYYIIYPGLGRKRVWERIGWASEGCTAAYAQRVRAERVSRRRTQRESGLTFAQAWDMAWERHLHSLRHARYTEMGRYKMYLETALGHLPLGTITPLQVEDIKNRLEGKALAPSTVKAVLGLIGKVYSLMKRWGVYDGPSPVQSVRVKIPDNKRHRFLSAEQARGLLSALRAINDTAGQVAMMSLYTGMRAGEIMALKGQDIDLERGLARIKNTKNGKDRTVFLHQDVIAMLRRINPLPGRPVFRELKSARQVGDIFARVVEALELNAGCSDRRDRIVFHSLRHTFASLMVMQGKDLYLVGTLLGHSTPQMTKRYAHLAPETQRAALEAIENYFHYNLKKEELS
jgi:integrase